MPQKRVDAVWQGVPATEKCTAKRKIHINILELKTAKLTSLLKTNEKECNLPSGRQHDSCHMN